MDTLKKVLWQLFKFLYTLLGTIAILVIIWYVGSGYYYNLGFQTGYTQAQVDVVKQIINRAQVCRPVVIQIKGQQKVELINKSCITTTQVQNNK